MLEAVIVTLPKPGKEPDHPQNFRPISLLNSDLKIYSKLLANRLLDLTPLLLGPEQVGFVRGKQAPDGTRRMINLIHHAETWQVPSLLLALDAEKAFDRVHWEYLSQVLTKFGLSGTRYSAIKTLCNNPSARVYVDGSFNLSNGKRQGCPLSPIIFSLAIEPFAEAIRSDPPIQGLRVGQCEHNHLVTIESLHFST